MTYKEILKQLAKHGSSRNVEGMKRYGIVSKKAFGVNAPVLRSLARSIGTDHALALQLWKSEYHDARILAALIADPEKMTPRLMDSWAGAFNNWAVCDNCCSVLFTQTSFAVEKAKEWTREEHEFVKRAGFVLMATLAVHRKELPDSTFRSFLPIIKREATDERNFVRKGVNWALRQIGKKNPALHSDAMTLAQTLSDSRNSTARWVGSDAVRDLLSPTTQKKMERMKKKGMQ